MKDTYWVIKIGNKYLCEIGEDSYGYRYFNEYIEDINKAVCFDSDEDILYIMKDNNIDADRYKIIQITRTTTEIK